MSREAITKAIEALKKCHYYMIDAGLPNQSMLHEAFAAYSGLEAALAEQPAQQEQCPTCGEFEPRTGTCGTSPDDRRALCNRATPQPPAQQEPVAQRELIKELADKYARECVEFAKAIPNGAHSMSPIAVKSGDTRLALHTAIDTIAAAPQLAQQEPVADSYVQTVPDKCDRIVWRGSYYHLPLKQPAQRKPLPIEQIKAMDYRGSLDEHIRSVRMTEAAHNIKEQP